MDQEQTTRECARVAFNGEAQFPGILKKRTRGERVASTAESVTRMIMAAEAADPAGAAPARTATIRTTARREKRQSGPSLREMNDAAVALQTIAPLDKRNMPLRSSYRQETRQNAPRTLIRDQRPRRSRPHWTARAEAFRKGGSQTMPRGTMAGTRTPEDGHPSTAPIRGSEKYRPLPWTLIRTGARLAVLSSSRHHDQNQRTDHGDRTGVRSVE